MSEQPQIAVLGGSFDPPHIGHVFLASYALSIAGVERVLVVPTYQHPFSKALNEFDHRLRMCELAFAPLRSTEVSSIERELGGVSRTLRLLQALAQRHPDARLRLLVGADILGEAARWHRFDEICRLAPPLVARRAGYESGDDGPLLPEVSSTAIRAALAQGGDATGLVPLRVRSYIAEHGLYCPSGA